MQSAILARLAPWRPPSALLCWRGSSPAFLSFSVSLVVSSTRTSPGVLFILTAARISASSSQLRMEFFLFFSVGSVVCTPFWKMEKQPMATLLALTRCVHATCALHCSTAQLTPLPGLLAHHFHFFSPDSLMKRKASAIVSTCFPVAVHPSRSRRSTWHWLIGRQA